MGPYRETSLVAPNPDEALARATIAPDVPAGETLVWAGRPKRGVRLAPSDGMMIPFSLMWGGFAIFWEVTAIASGAPFFFCLFGVPFVLIGIHLVVGRFFVDAWQRRRTFYGLTNRRVLIVHAGRVRKVRALDLANAPQVTHVEHSDGTGTMTFGADEVPASSRPGASSRFELVRVADARGVLDEIYNAQEALRIGARDRE